MDTIQKVVVSKVAPHLLKNSYKFAGSSPVFSAVWGSGEIGKRASIWHWFNTTN